MTLEVSFIILEASITLIHDVYSTGGTFDDHHMVMVICLWNRPLIDHPIDEAKQMEARLLDTWAGK